MDKKTHLNNHFEHPVGQREFGRSPGTHCFRVPLPQPRTRHRLPREVVWQTAVAIKIFIKMHLKLLEDTVENIPFYAWGPGSLKPQDRILLCPISNISHTFPHILATTWALHTVFNIALRFVTHVTRNVHGAGSSKMKLKIFNQLKKTIGKVVLLQETRTPVTATDKLKTPEFPDVFSACYNSQLW